MSPAATLARVADPEADASARLSEFEGVPTAAISDAMDRLPGLSGLRPFHRAGRMLGFARTVRTRPGDNLYIHHMLDLILPGEVIVVAAEADTSRALVGEIMVKVARSRGAAGLVIDGAIRDVAAISSSDFPCFAKGVTHRGPYKDGPGALDVPVAVGGTVVSPGDIVAGDEDGVVTVPLAAAPDVAARVRDVMMFEAELKKKIDAGTYAGLAGRT